MATAFDVVIVGGGPAGSLLAALIRRQDPERTVLILDRATHPRHHVGETTLANWEPILRRAGVLEKIEAASPIRKAGVLFHWGANGEETWTIDFRTANGPPRPGYQVDRAELDALLLEHAESLGAEVRQQANVVGVERRASGHAVIVDCGGQTTSIEASQVVDASGQQRVLSRWLGVGTIPFDGMNNFAVYGYFRGSEVAQCGRPVGDDERWTYIATTRDGWVWHIPIARDLVSVGVVTDASRLPSGDALEEFYLQNVRACRPVSELLARAELVQHPRAPSRLLTVRDWSYRTARLADDGWLCVGDAAAFIDPLLSSGLLLTAHGASMAANMLHTLWNDPNVDAPLLRASYESAYVDMARSYHRLVSCWYERNFAVSSWHWEAHRQRLREGRLPHEETSEEAFFALAIGVFADPLRGAIDNERPDQRIAQAHLFGRANVTTDTADENAARDRERVRRERRYRALLRSRLRASCRASMQRGYFTDSDRDHWRLVEYVEVRGGDGYDRVVFPADALVERLDGTRSVRDVMLSLAPQQISAAYHDRASALARQLMVLDHRGWLAGEVIDAVDPEPLALLSDFRHEIDMLGVSLQLTRGSLSISIAPKSFADRAYAYIDGAALWYSGDEREVRPFLNELAAKLAKLDVGALLGSIADAAGFVY
jgi:flavin-dependent dehydrogenase